MFRDLYRQSGLFRVGVFSLAGSLVFAAVVAILVHRLNGEVISTESAAGTTVTTSEEPVRVKRNGREEPEPTKPEPTKTIPAPERTESSPEPRRGRPEDRSRDSEGLPVQSEDWPEADRAEIKAAEEPRDYGWTRGAVMTFSSRDLGVGNAPVFGDDSQRNLNRGVVHVPETSLPWQRDRQKNVYLAAHRLGWPGTGSRLIFYNLGQLTKGDKVSLEDRRGRGYRYKVTQKLVVDPSDSWVMGEVHGKDILTLQTCTPVPTFHKRLVVRAERI